MAPLFARRHLFEIDDQPWFPSLLRNLIQNALAQTWCLQLPLQSRLPAEHAASALIRELGSSLPSYTFVDFCVGAGGPIPYVESYVNDQLGKKRLDNVDFILTDLHPNFSAWDRISRCHPHITHHRESVDAANAPGHLVTSKDKKAIFRLFNLAFHHFDDPLARSILKNTVELSDGVAIFELQDRTITSFVADLLLPIGVMLAAPFYAWKWRLPSLLLFTWLVPILPIVMVWDGIVSSLRTREPDEVEALLRSCGADTSGWEVTSGRENFLWPCGYLNRIMYKPRGKL